MPLDPWQGIPCPCYNCNSCSCCMAGIHCLQSEFIENPLLLFREDTQSFWCSQTRMELPMEVGLKLHTAAVQFQNTIVHSDFESEFSIIAQLGHLGIMKTQESQLIH